VAWEGILRALWIFLPAYVANMAPVFVAKLLPGWNAAVDGGRIGKDGNRLLGAGKTWRGLAGGAVLGGLAALAVAAATPHFLSSILARSDYGFMAMQSPTCNPEQYAWPCRHEAEAIPRVFLFGAIVGFMALVGDAVKSYFKRRRGKEGGAPWFPFDQLDFVVFGVLGFVIASPLLPAGWVWHALTDDWVVLATLFVLTPALRDVADLMWLKLEVVLGLE